MHRTTHEKKDEWSKIESQLGSHYPGGKTKSFAADKIARLQKFAGDQGGGRMKRVPRAKPAPSNEVVLEIKLDTHGSFFVECLAEHIVNQAATSTELRRCIQDAVEALNLGDAKPAVVRLHLVLDEIVTVKQ